MRGRRLSIKVNPVLLFSKKIGSVFILIRFKVLDPSEQGGGQDPVYVENATPYISTRAGSYRREPLQEHHQFRRIKQPSNERACNLPLQTELS